MNNDLSLYIHIPFCLSKCGYCSFFSVPFQKQEVENYVHHLLREKELYRDYLSRPIKTLYLGGGTPSLLSASQLNSICTGLQFTNNAEVTLEINPLQLGESYLELLQTTPVNRLSLGLQSMLDNQLKWLDRRHRGAQIAEKVALCHRFGYNNLSLDLIYGLPESNLDELKDNLEAYLNLQPQHISTYLLSLDEDCARFADADKLPSDELLALQYELICSTLKQAGYTHYEISNFALPGYESQHNLAYWHSQDYLAWGASAAGFVDGLRYANPADLSQYYAAVNSGKRFPEAQPCDSKQQREDYLMMGLRLAEGIDEQDFRERFSLEVYDLYHDKIERLQALNLLTRAKGKLALTDKALFISNSVIGELIL